MSPSSGGVGGMWIVRVCSSVDTSGGDWLQAHVTCEGGDGHELSAQGSNWLSPSDGDRGLLESV